MTANATPPTLDWFKSSHSAANDFDCVEVALTPDHIHIRDSKTTGGDELTVTTDTWASFLSHAVQRV
ncbi:DUF397 domain-containing protein [Streptomyces sp. NPDC090119]|uniref:DUF397 domain-containing protein n=1 Tax=Streptomyces sp. NPDC090119 TaxID=3365951 RepID=UPI00380264F2